MSLGDARDLGLSLVESSLHQANISKFLLLLGNVLPVLLVVDVLRQLLLLSVLALGVLVQRLPPAATLLGQGVSIVVTEILRKPSKIKL